jgi:LysR family transcriptional regulator, glycine cleavage system transcriptional activator
MNARFPRPAEAGPPVTLPRRSIPSIAGLMAFEATARHLSFSQAARDLSLSQGAVSKRVRALEETLGMALLHRSRHDVRLTETGRRFLEEVRRMLAEFEATTQAFLAPGMEGAAISIGLPRAVASFWLLPRLQRFRSRHPGVRVNLVALSSDERPAAPLDAMIEEGSGPPQAGTVLLWEEILVPVAAPALARLAGEQGFGAIDRLHLARRPDLWPRWSATQCIQCGPDGSAHEGLSLVMEAAIHGHGAALVPEALAAGPIADGRLVRLADAGLSTGMALRYFPTGGRGGARTLGHFGAWLAEEAAALRA